MTRKFRVYCLTSLSADEADEVLTQLDDDSYASYSSADLHIDLIPWTEQRDGGKDAIFRLFFEHEEVEDFMFFIDRKSMDLQDFLVADVSTLNHLSKRRNTLLGEALGSEASLTTFGQSIADFDIPFGRCDSHSGWYGNPSFGIKKTYISLINGQTTFAEVVRTSDTYNQQVRSRELQCMTSMLDTCDQAYDEQVRLAQYQIETFTRQLQIDINDASRNQSIRHGNDWRKGVDQETVSTLHRKLQV